MLKKKILLLFDSQSLKNNQAYPEYLLGLLDEHSGADVEYVYAVYEDIKFHITNSSITVTLGPSGQDISEFNLIYFRRFSADQARAQAVAMYAGAKGIPIVDSEIGLRKGSITKLTQYMKMALHGLPIPETFSAGQKIVRKMFVDGSAPISFPCVMKIADATRGGANELIRSAQEAVSFIDTYPEGEILVQEYIDNTGDYRVWVTGDSLGPVFYRSRAQDGDTHKNNTSQGAAIELVTDEVAIDEVGAVALAAAKIFNREIAGVDVVRGSDGRLRVFEVNRAPQVEHTPLENLKAAALASYLEKLASEKGSVSYPKTQGTIGVSSFVDFAGYKNLKQIPARIDTGARTSSLWASDIKIKDGVATFKLFGPGSPWYTGKVVRCSVIERREVTSSTGHTQQRHLIALPIRMHGRRLNAKFTLSDRSTQTYPILIGRNTLRGNFLVDSSDPGEARLYRDELEVQDFNENEAII